MFSHFLQFLKDPNVASLAPTVPRCIEEILEPVQFNKDIFMIEYGAGDGAITEVILNKMSSNSRLLILETNNSFISVLRERFVDPRITIIHDSVENIKNVCREIGLNNANYVVSGVPFSFLRKNIISDVIKDTAGILQPKGKFIIYQSLVNTLTRHLYMRREVEKYFNIRSKKNLFYNFPPLFVLEAEVIYV